MRLKSLPFTVLLLLSLLLAACSPESAEIEIFISELLEAQKGELVLIPVRMTFSVGEDDQEDLEEALAKASEYIEDLAWEKVKGEYDTKLQGEFSIPLGSKEVVEKYLGTNQSPLAFTMSETLVVLQETPMLDALNKELSEINYMMSFDLPADETTIKIIGDSTKPVTVGAVAVFADGKPSLNFQQKIEKRKSVTLTFYGGETSVYSGVPIQFSIGSAQ